MKRWGIAVAFSILCLFLLISPIRISTKYIDNNVLQDPEELIKLEGNEIVLASNERITLSGIALSRLASSFDPGQITRSHQEPLLVEVDHTSGRAYFKWRKRLGGCGTTGPFWTQLPRDKVLINEKRDFGVYLVENFYAIPTIEMVNSPKPYAKELITAFLKTAAFRKSPYEGSNRQAAETFIAALLPTLSDRAYFNALWFYGSLHPDELKNIALQEIQEDLESSGRGQAFHYLKYLEVYSPELYLDYVYKVQVNLGHKYASDHEYYAKILLNSGDWRGVDFIMKLMDANRDRYFANGFRMTGDLCWPIAKAAIDEHQGEFDDINAINPYISKWYFKNRARISYGERYIGINGSDRIIRIDGNAL